MPNLLYPYLIGLVSTVIVPLVGLAAFVASHLRSRLLDQERQRLPLAVRSLTLQEEVDDLLVKRDVYNSALALGRG